MEGLSAENIKWNYLLRDVDRLDHLGAHHLLFAPHQVLQEEDGHGVERRQVDADVAGQEVVDLSLAIILGSKFFGRDPDNVLAIGIHRLHLLITVRHLLDFL